MTTATAFQEWLRSRAREVNQPERLRRRDEWIAALHRFREQIEDWIRESDPDGLLIIERMDIDRTEPNLGTYTAPALKISLGEEAVCIVPIGRDARALVSRCRRHRSSLRRPRRYHEWLGQVRPLRHRRGAACLGCRRARSWTAEAIRSGSIRGDTPGTALMIATLEDAWAWYQAVSQLAGWMERISRRYWDDPRLAELLGAIIHSESWPRSTSRRRPGGSWTTSMPSPSSSFSRSSKPRCESGRWRASRRNWQSRSAIPP